MNRDVPYSLLGFYPHFLLSDLPVFSRDLAEHCAHAARDEGLRNVNRLELRNLRRRHVVSSYLARLEAAGYVTVEKTFAGKVPRTLLQITESGREALLGYRDRLVDVLRRLPG